ncbi:CoA transferase [Novosphingobium sp. HII-3]|uniref:CoA transferase n=1 Tax=Novosphingobium sp. HII-3 TaxID=2075565 RepID=UPI001E553EE3|nr:CoA transferase [Novosphingobium sp. HII-3]
MEHTAVCFAPVLAMGEAPLHPHSQARGTVVDVEGVTPPAQAPCFSATPARRPQKPAM